MTVHEGKMSQCCMSQLVPVLVFDNYSGIGADCDGSFFFLNWRCFDDVRLGEDNTKACHNCINLPAKYNVDRH